MYAEPWLSGAQRFYRAGQFLDEKEYNIHQAIVFSNEPRVWQDKGIWYMPIYYIMFLQKSQAEQIILPRLEMPTLA